MTRRPSCQVSDDHGAPAGWHWPGGVPVVGRQPKPPPASSSIRGGTPSHWRRLHGMGRRGCLPCCSGAPAAAGRSGSPVCQLTRMPPRPQVADCDRAVPDRTYYRRYRICVCECGRAGCPPPTAAVAHAPLRPASASQRWGRLCAACSALPLLPAPAAADHSSLPSLVLGGQLMRWCQQVHPARQMGHARRLCCCFLPLLLPWALLSAPRAAPAPGCKRGGYSAWLGWGSLRQDAHPTRPPTRRSAASSSPARTLMGRSAPAGRPSMRTTPAGTRGRAGRMRSAASWDAGQRAVTAVSLGAKGREGGGQLGPIKLAGRR